MDSETEPEKVKQPGSVSPALSVGDILLQVIAVFRAEVTDPPAGSNRILARAISRLVVVGVAPLMVIMVIGALLDPDISTISTLISVAWLCFVSLAALVWNRLSEGWLRGLMLLALLSLQVRWSLGWLLFEGQDVATAILVGLIFTPLLLFTVALMEGTRNGVVVGLLVATNMGLAVLFGSMRDSLEVMQLADPRLSFPTFVVMLMYAVFVSVWSSQQDTLRDAEVRIALLTEKANCDTATGLLNRRGLELVARGWLNRERDFSVLLVQQDHFAALERTLPAARLEQEMVACAAAIELVAGEQVTLARWTSGVLMMLSPQSDRVLTERLAQQLRRSVGGFQLSETAAVGAISIGYTLAVSTESFTEVVERAETALQSALGTGNCVRAVLT